MHPSSSSSSRPGVDVDAIIDTLWGSFQLHGRNSGEVLGPYRGGLWGSAKLDGYKSDISLEPMIEQLCGASRDIFCNEPCLLRLQPPITIAGNFYGDFSKLKSILEKSGPPPLSNYLFLGNYADTRGLFLHTFLLLLAFKIKYPQKVYLLKGCYDHLGFSPRLVVDETDDVIRSADSFSMGILSGCMRSLPVAAVISDKIICTNRGLSSHLRSLDQIKPGSPVLDDLIRKDTDFFWRKLVAEEARFLKKYDLRLVCCGNHKAVSEYDDFAKRRVAYVSSACVRRRLLKDDNFLMDRLYFPIRCEDSEESEDHDNNIVMRVDVSLKCSFHNLLHKDILWSYQIGKASTRAQDVGSSGVNSTSGKVSGSKSETNVPSKVEFDLINLNRSKFPWVKRGKASTAQDVSSSGAKPLSEKAGGSKPETNAPSKVVFDPTNLYRSKSPGVKRFLGARV